MKKTNGKKTRESKEIEERVKDQILSHKLLKNSIILVRAEGNEVFLVGKVDSEEKKWLAEDIANETFGVLNVINDIQIIEQDEKKSESYYEI
jgi:osmotically-inducible protein OsmY